MLSIWLPKMLYSINYHVKEILLYFNLQIIYFLGSGPYLSNLEKQTKICVFYSQNQRLKPLCTSGIGGHQILLGGGVWRRARVIKYCGMALLAELRHCAKT